MAYEAVTWAAYPPEFSEAACWTVQSDDGLMVVVSGADTAETKAKAELISAAPQLLSAVRSAADFIKGHNECLQSSGDQEWINYWCLYTNRVYKQSESQKVNK